MIFNSMLWNVNNVWGKITARGQSVFKIMKGKAVATNVYFIFALRSIRNTQQWASIVLQSKHVIEYFQLTELNPDFTKTVLHLTA